MVKKHDGRIQQRTTGSQTKRDFIGAIVTGLFIIAVTSPGVHAVFLGHTSDRILRWV